MQVLDALGRVVESSELAVIPGKNITSMDASPLKQGSYMVQILVDGVVLVNEKLFVDGH